MSIYTAAAGGFLTYRSPAVTVVTAGSGMTECSGIGVSRTYGQTVWCHDDSGDQGRIFAFNTTSGTLRRTFNLVNAVGGAQWPNADYEDMCLLQRPTGGDMIFVFDDTSQSGTSPQTLYRMLEPNPTTGAAVQNLTATQMTVTFPGTVYSEAMFVDPLDGHLCVFKSNTQQANGVEVYRSTVPVTTAAQGTAITTTLIAQLTNFAPQLGAGPGLGRINDWAGSADIAPDRSCVLVHSTGTWTAPATAYDRVFVWQIADPLTTSLATAFGTAPLLCTNDGTGRDTISEQQGESIAFLPGSNGYMRISEGTNRPIHIFDDTTPNPPPPAAIAGPMPDGRNFSTYGPQMTTSVDGLTQWATWISQTGGQYVGKRPRNSPFWTTHAFAGANATTLVLPYEKDDHNSTAIAADAAGRIWLAGNMHHSPFRALRTTNADGVVTGPWEPWTLPGSVKLAGYTYPQFARFSDGTLLLGLRNAQHSMNADYEIFRKAPTSTTWTFLGKLFKGVNFSPSWNFGPNSPDTTLGIYPNQFYVEPPGWTNPDRIHCAFMWRVTDINTGDGTEESAHPSYIYSDDKGTTWKSMPGTTMTLPIQINTNTSCQLNSTWYWPGPGPTGTYFINGGSLAVEKDTGYPHFSLGANPPTTTIGHVFNWDGATWTRTDHHPGAFSNVARGSLLWFDDDLWILAKDPNGLGRINLCAFGSTRRVRLGGDIPQGNPNPDWNDNGSNFFGVCEPMHDMQAFEMFGSVEVLVPIGNAARMYWFRNGALTR